MKLSIKTAVTVILAVKRWKKMHEMFKKLSVSTITLVVTTNMKLTDIRSLFETLPITKYEVVEKKRGRKKKSVPAIAPAPVVNPADQVPEGSIVTLEFEREVRGERIKKKTASKKRDSSYFRNAITSVVVIDHKFINVKICRNGTFHITGAKNTGQTEKVVHVLWSYIKDCKTLYEFTDGTELVATFIPAMRNVDFTLGFSVNRENLDNYFNKCNDYCSLYHPSVGYTGVNIKGPLRTPISELRLRVITYHDDGTFSVSHIRRDDLQYTSAKSRDKSESKLNTFLVFQTGKVIMSSNCERTAQESYLEFMKIVDKNKSLFMHTIQDSA